MLLDNYNLQPAGSPSSSVSCTVAGDPTTPQDTAEPLDNTQNTVSSITCYKQGSCVVLEKVPSEGS